MGEVVRDEGGGVVGCDEIAFVMVSVRDSLLLELRGEEQKGKILDPIRPSRKRGAGVCRIA